MHCGLKSSIHIVFSEGKLKNFVPNWKKKNEVKGLVEAQTICTVTIHNVFSLVILLLWLLCLDISRPNVWNCLTSSEKQNLCTPNDVSGKKSTFSSVSVIINFSPVFETFKELLIWWERWSFSCTHSYQLLRISAHFSLSEFFFALITVLCIDAGLTSEAGCISFSCCLTSAVF